MMRSHQASTDRDDGAAPAGRVLRLWALAMRVLLWLLAGLWGIFLLTWIVLQAWIVPRIETWRPDLERWATQAVGVEVRIGSIHSLPAPAGAGWLPPLVPSFELREVQLLDAGGRRALQLPVVRGAVSVASLWRGGFEQILIERPVLDVRRLVSGRIQIAGIESSAEGGGGGGTGIDWFFDQSEFVIRGGTVRWIDERRAQPPVLLRELDFVARNGHRSHELRLDASPEPEWGDRFSLRAQLREPLLRLPGAAPRSEPWQDWTGQVYAEFARVDVARLRRHADFSEQGVEVRSGQGALRAWVRLQRGQVEGVTLDAALGGVDLQLGPELPALALEHLDGRLEASWSGAAWTLSTERLAFRTPEGLAWDGASVRVEHQPARERQGPRTAVQAQGVDLATLAGMAERLPLPADARGWLARLQPRGRLERIDLLWQARGSGPMAEHTVARAQGRVSGLALAGEPSGRLSRSGRFPLPGRPGVEGADIDFELDQDGGRAQLALRQGALDFPDVFETTRIDLDRLDARVRWRVQGERIEVDLDEGSFANAHAEGSLRVRWHTGDPATSPARARFPGVLDLTANLTRADGTAVHRYLPLSVRESARHYVREAVLAGGSRQVGFRVQGEIQDIPFDEPQHTPGTFRITAALEGVDFNHLPTFLQAPGDAPWPGVRRARAQFELDRAAMRITGIEGELEGASGVRVDRGSVIVENLVHEPVVQVRVRASGPGASMLGHVQRTPINAYTQQALARATANGPAVAEVQIDLPLQDLRATRVRGSVQLDGTDLRITPASPLLARARGKLDFTEDGFTFTGARAQVLGGELVFDGGLRADAQGQPALQFRGQGTASAAGLREGGLGPASALFAHASGSTAYAVQLGFRGGEPELRINSTLQGLALQLPAPLAKPAEATWPARFDSSVSALQADGRAARERWLLTLGPANQPVIDLHLERELGNAAAGPRGSVAIGLPAGERAPLPERGIAVQARVGELDLDRWRRLADATPVPGVEAAAWMPDTLSLQADAVVMDARRFQRVLIGASREGASWRASVDADELNGYVEYRPAGAGSAGSVYARLARLTLPKAAPREVERLLEQPTTVPALDIAVDELQWDGRSLGRVEVEAVNRGGPVRVGEWRLNALRVTLPEARLSASGNWAPLAAQGDAGTGAQRRTALQFRLDVQDSGALLERFGREGLVRGGRGRLEGNVGWLGTPFAPDYPSLAGQLKLDVERGQFLKAEPGAGRLLGVLSLQALPRRLTLDFRDVFSEGFAFDFVRGDARIERGVVHTNNLQMKGVNAAVLMEGTADLARETQDIKVVVVPELNAGTASLIATAINPAVGLGTFLAQFLLRQPLQSAATQEFRVSGNWADPQVEKVARSPAPASPTLQ
ncbi:MAG: TIGR02099 family protein [Hydrogenophaga sp.]|nr:TIGR02099 family protein [Hydrogenophaga sp.]